MKKKIKFFSYICSTMGCLKLSYYENFYLSQERPLRKIEGQEKTCVSLLYFGARYYNSDISVWLSVDPLASHTPQFSPYAFCNQNPIYYIDPLGLKGEPVVDRFKPKPKKRPIVHLANGINFSIKQLNKVIDLFGRDSHSKMDEHSDRDCPDSDGGGPTAEYHHIKYVRVKEKPIVIKTQPKWHTVKRGHSAQGLTDFSYVSGSSQYQIQLTLLDNIGVPMNYVYNGSVLNMYNIIDASGRSLSYDGRSFGYSAGINSIFNRNAGDVWFVDLTGVRFKYLVKEFKGKTIISFNFRWIGF